MKNVFIAIGGSGTKVAEALVRLLAIGYPTRLDEQGRLTSAEDTLEIWRVDPDRSAGASSDLNDALNDYRKLQSCLSDNDENRSLAHSRWAMHVETNIRNLDPLDLPKEGEQDNIEKSLRGVLDSRHSRGHRAISSSASILAPFFEKKDLDVCVDRGFYQKPFIGSAIMAIFAQSLEDDSSPAGRRAGLTAYSNTPTNFFLCGSLHGGTGASGVPVMASFLKSRKDQNPSWDWRIGGALLAPYVTPPNPPFSALNEGETFTEADIEQRIQRFGDEPAFYGMANEEKRELVRQILQGFYAEPEDMEARAKNALAYYRDHSADYFDNLFLVGKPNPNKLKSWSNGGATQRNPLNSAEVVAAIAAVNFFARAHPVTENSYTIAGADTDIPQESMRLMHLPTYRIANTEIDAEKVFLATAMSYHLIREQIPWDNVRGSVREFEICRQYEGKEGAEITDRQSFADALRLIAISLQTLARPHDAVAPTGWSSADLTELMKFLSSDPAAKKALEANLAKSLFGKEAKGENTLGSSAVKFTTFDFGKWCPTGDQYTRGEYLRHVWSQIFTKSYTQFGN